MYSKIDQAKGSNHMHKQGVISRVKMYCMYPIKDAEHQEGIVCIGGLGFVTKLDQGRNAS